MDFYSDRTLLDCSDDDDEEEEEEAEYHGNVGQIQHWHQFQFVLHRFKRFLVSQTGNCITVKSHTAVVQSVETTPDSSLHCEAKMADCWG